MSISEFNCVEVIEIENLAGYPERYSYFNNRARIRWTHLTRAWYSVSHLSGVHRNSYSI